MREHYIGIDAGGSKSEAVLVDADMHLLTRLTYDGMNLRRMNHNSVSRMVKQMIEDLTYRAGILPYHIGFTSLAAAGAGDKKIRKSVESACKSRMPEWKVYVVTDAEAALAGALNGEPGIVLISGTGSIALGIDNNKRIYRAGGYGYILGDEGSGFWLGRELLRACLDAYYEGKDTDMSSKVCKIWEVDNIQEVVSSVYQSDNPAQKIAKLAPIIFDSYVSDDELAIEILNRGAEELAKIVLSVRAKLDLQKPVQVCLSGGLNERSDILKPLIIKKLGEEFTAVKPVYEPAIGAILTVLGRN